MIIFMLIQIKYAYSTVTIIRGNNKNTVFKLFNRKYPNFRK